MNWNETVKCQTTSGTVSLDSRAATAPWIRKHSLEIVQNCRKSQKITGQTPIRAYSFAGPVALAFDS